MANLQVLNSIQQVDYLGVPVTHDIFLQVPDSTTLAALVTLLQTYQQLYDPMTGALLTENTARVFVPITTGLKSSAADGDENEMTGLFNFSQTGSRYKYAIDVPGIAAVMLVNGKLDLSNAGMQAWITWLTSAHTGITIVSKFVLTLVALLDALISFRKHRKAESRRSLVTP
jgi:hypothetical protein